MLKAKPENVKKHKYLNFQKNLRGASEIYYGGEKNEKAQEATIFNNAKNQCRRKLRPQTQKNQKYR